jgi:hypothetical protein
VIPAEVKLSFLIVVNGVVKYLHKEIGNKINGYVHALTRDIIHE